MKVRTGGSKREQPPGGVHMARVVGLCDLGHQPGFTWSGGEADSAYKFELTYELTNSKMKDDRPFWISEDVTNTDNEKGKLLKRTKAAGISFSSIVEILDKPLMITVEHNEKGYAKVTNVAGVPAGIDVPSLSVEPTLFDIHSEVPQLEMFRDMPEFKQGKIRSALNISDTPLGKALSIEDGSDKY